MRLIGPSSQKGPHSTLADDSGRRQESAIPRLLSTKSLRKKHRAITIRVGMDRTFPFERWSDGDCTIRWGIGSSLGRRRAGGFLGCPSQRIDRPPRTIAALDG